MYSFGGYLETRVATNISTHLSHGTQRLFQEVSYDDSNIFLKRKVNDLLIFFPEWQLWCYNYAEGQWKNLPTLGGAPKELASHSAVLHGNYLVVYGGTGVPFGGCSSNKMNVCDLRTLTWMKVDVTGEAPTPQYGQAVVMDSAKKCFYVIGGTTGYAYSMDVHKLNLETRVWEPLFVSKGDLEEPSAR